ncbi:MAG: hypothetical protein ACREJ5_04060 [Geminicoccaceae bacterium]
MDTLSTFAITRALPRGRPAYDHTYVTSSHGHVWDCLGGSNGGRLLDSGSGDAAIADCVSHPRRGGIPPVYAGLAYGVRGVCHQMANRIARTAGVDVAGAYLYNSWSLRVYGVYGLGPWPEWLHCQLGAGGQLGSSTSDGGSSNVSSSGMKERLRALYDAIDTVRAGGSPDDGDPQLRIQEFEIMIDEALGPDYEPDKRRELMALERSFRGRQQALIHDLESKRLPPRAYLTRMNALLVDVARRYEAILGETDYRKLFGGRPEDAAHLIDPAIFLGEAVNDEPGRGQ